MATESLQLISTLRQHATRFVADQTSSPQMGTAPAFHHGEPDPVGTQLPPSSVLCRFAEVPLASESCLALFTLVAATRCRLRRVVRFRACRWRTPKIMSLPFVRPLKPPGRWCPFVSRGRQPAGRSCKRSEAARSLLAGSPALTLAHRTDRLQTNGGLREYEVEVGLPLWNFGMRHATQRRVAADAALQELQIQLARLKLAGELREAASQLATLQAERNLVARRLDEANRLAIDIERRLKAGDTAHVDLLQAQSAIRQAKACSRRQMLRLHGRAGTGAA